MSEEDKEPTRYQKIKQHLKENRKVYLVGAGAFAAGGLIFREGPELKQIIGSFNYKSTTTNIVTTELERRGHPGFRFRNNTTGEVAASLNRMMEIDGVTRHFIKKNTKGDTPLYTNLGEMA